MAGYLPATAMLKSVMRNMPMTHARSMKIVHAIPAAIIPEAI